MNCLGQYGIIVLGGRNMVFESLRGNLRSPPIIIGYLSRQSTHEGIKAQLYVLGYRLHFVPILEANGNNNQDRTRIDCLFIKDGHPICGIEVDYSIKAASIRKLLQLGADVEKIIISYGRQAACSKAVYRHRSHLQDIKHFLLHP